MPDETVLPTEVPGDLVTEPAPMETEGETAAPTVSPTEEVTEETGAYVGVDPYPQHITDLAHVNLFGSFLICGTLVGIFLLRNRHAN